MSARCPIASKPFCKPEAKPGSPPLFAGTLTIAILIDEKDSTEREVFQEDFFEDVGLK
jgi:hypothetical protein